MYISVRYMYASGVLCEEVSVRVESVIILLHNGCMCVFTCVNDLYVLTMYSVLALCVL